MHDTIDGLKAGILKDVDTKTDNKVYEYITDEHESSGNPPIRLPIRQTTSTVNWW